MHKVTKIPVFPALFSQRNVPFAQPKKQYIVRDLDFHECIASGGKKDHEPWPFQVCSEVNNTPSL